MGRHRLEEPARVRPRYGRMAAAALSLTVTLVALLGGLGGWRVTGHEDFLRQCMGEIAKQLIGVGNRADTAGPQPCDVLERPFEVTAESRLEGRSRMDQALESFPISGRGGPDRP